MAKIHYRIAVILTIVLCYGHLQAQQYAPSIIWSKSFGGSGDDRANSIVNSIDGGYLAAGSSTSTDGDVSGNHGWMDAWLVKVDPAGHIQWQKCLGGSVNDEIVHLVRTFDGGYIAVGNTSSTDGDVSGQHGGQDIWVIKLDRYGNIEWKKCLGGTGTEAGKSIKQTSDSGYVIAGTTTSRDGDVVTPHSTGRTAAWIVKLNKSGSIQWERSFATTVSVVNAYDVMELSGGGLILTTDTDGGMDGDFDNGQVNPYNDPPRNIIIRLSANGQSYSLYDKGAKSSGFGVLPYTDGTHFFLVSDYVNCYPSAPNDGLRIDFLDSNSNIQFSGGSFSHCDPFNDPDNGFGYRIKGPGSMIFRNPDGVAVMTTSDPTTPGFHGGVDGLMGSFVPRSWTKPVGGSGADYLRGIVAEDYYTDVAAGYSASNDGDVSGNHGGNDLWVVKVGNVNVIKGSVYMDYNANGVRDSGEPLVDNVQVQSSKAGGSSASITSNGLFSNVVDTGIYTTTVVSPLSYYTPASSGITSSFTSYNSSDSLSFALQPISGKRDYSVDLSTSDYTRPGFDATFSVVYTNKGTDTLTNRTVRFIKDHRYTLLPATPTQSAVSGDTISWVITTLAPRQSGTILVKLNLQAPPVTNLGDTIINVAMIDTTGDLAVGDNKSVYAAFALSSFDPNDKTEANGGVVHKADLDKGRSLLYTIRFQNTGNDTAFTVVVRDTLDAAKVDPSSLEMVGASHVYRLNITNGNQVSWTFSNIKLADSVHHEAASHGYLTYRVKPRSSVAEGDTIRNTAAIYLDYNLPVATNTQKTIVAKVIIPAVPAPVIGVVKSGYCSLEGVQKIKVLNVPAASYAATVTVKVDADVMTLRADSSFDLRIDTLSAGNHSIKVNYQNSTSTHDSTWVFAIRKPVTPVVDVTSNITEVVDLSKMVVLSATNVAGGGSSPLYAFARDRGFTTILRADDALVNFNLDPSTLVIGSNKLYVRMKTSDTCYTAQTAVDSIEITRSTVTGLIDVDLPGQVINVAPNPFRSSLFLSGLQPSKTYLISLLNSNGQTILQKKIEGQQDISIYTGVMAKGIYLLRIYDQKKNRLIGSAKLLSGGQ